MSNLFEEAAREHESLKAQVHNSNKRNAELILQVKQLETEVTTMQRELENAKARSDHYLRLYCEITKNLNTIGLVVDDTLRTYNMELGKGNGQIVDQHVKAVEQALIGVRETNDTVQRKEEERSRVHDNKVHGRS